MEFTSNFQAANSRRAEFFSTYGLTMSWDQRLREAFNATGWSKRELARRSGISYDNINKYLAGNVKQPRHGQLDQLAETLGMDPVYLERGVDPTTGETEVPIMGYVGAGAEVEPDYEQVPPDGMDQVRVPFPLPDDMMALQVRGDSMMPQFRDGAVLIVYKQQKRSLESFYGEEAVVRTEDGRRFIKTILKGEKGVNLISWNAAPIENVRLAWIGEIFTTFAPNALRRAAKVGGIQGQLKLRA